jgi:hypothetical protein
VLVAALLVGVHLALVAYFAPRRALFGALPILNDAHAIEVYRAARARLAWVQWGRLWEYDPRVLAGQVSGLVEPLASRLFVYGVPLLSRAGVRPAHAFDALLLVLHAGVPLLAYGAARAFRLSRGAAAWVVGLWSSLWFFDAVVHATWFSGRITFIVATELGLVALGLSTRGTSGEGSGNAAASLFVLATAFVVHPIAAVFFGIVAAANAVRQAALLSARRLGLVLAALAPFVLLVPFGGRAIATSSEPLAHVFDVGVSQIACDFVEVLGSGYHAPGAARTLVRVLSVAAGVLGLREWNRAGDRRAWPLGVAVGAGFVVTYFGSYLPVSWPIDPYYFAIPTAFAATLPAADRLSRLAWRELVRTHARGALVLGLTLLVVIPRLFRTVATYVPSLLPDRVIRTALDLHVSPLVGLKEPGPDRLGYDAPPMAFYDVLQFLDENARGDRVVVDDPALASFLAISSPQAVLGPLAERGSPSADADPSRLLDSPASPSEVSSYLDRYSVGWVVLGGPLGSFDRDDPRLGPARLVAGFRVRRVIDATSLVAEGTGHVVPDFGGVLKVEDAAGARVTVRLHYDESLRCRPDCTVERVRVDGDRGGFIGIRKPPPVFEVY